MTSRPSVSALFASASTEVPPPQAQDQGLVPHLGDRGSHKRVVSESWDVASSRLPPHPARSHAARGVSYRPTSPAGSLLIDCSRPLHLQNHQLQVPPCWSPAHRGDANSGLYPRHRGPCEESDRNETRRAPCLTLLSREYFLSA